MKAQFELNGRHVLLMTLAFFGVIIAANGVLISYAVRSYPGEQERKSYRQGLRFNAVLEDRAAQSTLGWRASIEKAAREGQAVRFVVLLRRKDDSPLDALDLSGALSRPASSVGEQSLTFEPLGGGRYEAIATAAPGAWDLGVTASSDFGQRFQFTNRVIIQ